MKDTVTKSKLSILTLLMCLGIFCASITAVRCNDYELPESWGNFFQHMDDTAGKLLPILGPVVKVSTGQASSGTIMDSIVTATCDYSQATGLITAEFAIQAMANSFSPSFTTILDLSDRSGGTVGNMYENAVYTKDDVRNSIFMKTVFNLGIYLGAAIATIILIFNLFMCILGRSEQIKDSPLWLIIKYGVAMFFIYISFDIVFAMIEIMHSLWNGYIWDGISYATIGADGKSGFEQLFGSEICSTSGRWNKTLLGIQLDIWDNVVIGKIVFTILSIFLVWKLFKNILRLYLEIAERYFVLMILACFFPCAVATVVSNGSRNIFSSYLRMFACQGFVMIANMAFLKFYIYVGQGWMYSLTNWVAGLAYLKVCQKLDSYMMAMGLNVAQTGAGLVGSMGGTLRNGMIMLSRAGRIAGNSGKGLMSAVSHGASVFDTEKVRIFNDGVSGSGSMSMYSQSQSTMPTDKFVSSVQLLNGMEPVRQYVNDSNGALLKQDAEMPKIRIDSGQVPLDADMDYQRRRMEAFAEWKDKGEPAFEQSRGQSHTSAGDDSAAVSGGEKNAEINPTERLAAEMDFYKENGYGDILDANDAIDAPPAPEIIRELERQGYDDVHILEDTGTDSSLMRLAMDDASTIKDLKPDSLVSSSPLTVGCSTMRCLGTKTNEDGVPELRSFRLDCYRDKDFAGMRENIREKASDPGEWTEIKYRGNMYLLHKKEESHSDKPSPRVKKGAKMSGKKVKEDNNGT